MPRNVIMALCCLKTFLLLINNKKRIWNKKKSLIFFNCMFSIQIYKTRFTVADLYLQ